MQRLQRLVVWWLFCCCLGTGTVGYQYGAPAAALATPRSPPQQEQAVAAAAEQQPFGYAYQPPLTNYAAAQFSLGGAPLYQHTRQTPAFGVATHGPDAHAPQQQQLAGAAEYFVAQQQPEQVQPPRVPHAAEQPQTPSYYVPRLRPLQPAAPVAAAAPDCQQQEEPGYRYSPQQSYFRPAAHNEPEVASAAQIAAANKQASEQLQKQHDQFFRPAYEAQPTAAAAQLAAAGPKSSFQFPEQQQRPQAASAAAAGGAYAAAQLHIPEPAAPPQQPFQSAVQRQQQQKFAPSFHAVSQEQRQNALAGPAAGHFGFGGAPAQPAAVSYANTVFGPSSAGSAGDAPAYAAGQKGLSHYQYALHQPTAMAARAPPSQQEAPAAPPLTAEQYPQAGGGGGDYSQFGDFHPPATASFLQMQSHSYEWTPKYEAPPPSPASRSPHALYGAPAFGALSILHTNVGDNPAMPQYGGFQPSPAAAPHSYRLRSGEQFNSN